MKLEAGKFYRTRDGRKAYVAAVGCPLKNAKHDCIGWVERQSESYPESWKADGTYRSGSLTHPADLIAQWVKPPWDYTPSPGEHVWAWHENGSTYQCFLLTKQDIERAQEDGVLFAKMIPPDPPKF